MGAIPVPRIEALLSFKLLERHEAAFMLTDRWPSNLCYRSTPQLPDLQLERNTFLAPQDENGYCPKALGKNYQRAIALIDQLIETGQLPNISANLHLSCYRENQTFLISPFDAITLALSNDFPLADRLAGHLEIQQIKEPKNRRNLMKFVTDQTVAQFIIHRDGKISISELCRHELMGRFGSSHQSNDVELKSIRRAITSLIGKQEPRDYSLVPLSEVKASKAFRFSLLKTVAKIATQLLADALGIESLRNHTEKEFITAVVSGPLLSMYLKETSHFIQWLVSRWCLDAFAEAYYTHCRTILIPYPVRSEMKIAELQYVNFKFILKDMRVETFSPLEKEKIAPLVNALHQLEQRVDPKRLPFVKNFFLEGNR